MGGFKGVDSFNAAMLGNISAIDKDYNDAVDSVVLDAAEAAKLAIKETIDTTESALSPGKPNRNWTFTMNHAVDNDVKRSGNIRKITAGWINRKENYFLIQEKGGTVNGRHVWGMGALMNGYRAYQSTLLRGMNRIKRERNPR